MLVSNGAKPGEPYTVLVSDDDDGVRRSLQLMLCACGYAVRSYTSGSALLADPLAISANCLVVDYRMPDVDGFDVLQSLRARGWQGKALMVSAYCDLSLQARARTAGFDEVIAKPFVARAVRSAIKRYERSAS